MAQQDVLYQVLWLVQLRNVSIGPFHRSISGQLISLVCILQKSPSREAWNYLKSIIITPVELVKTQLQVQTNNLQISEYVIKNQLI